MEPDYVSHFSLAHQQGALMGAWFEEAGTGQKIQFFWDHKVSYSHS